jgi:transposase
MDYLNDLIDKIKQVYPNEYENIVLLLDNSQVHRAKKVMKQLKDLGPTIVFIPAYSPELAPVELFFSYFKRDFTSSITNLPLNVNTEEGIEH